MAQLPPSQSIDDDYTFRLLGILTAAGRETAEGWSEIGLLINFDPNTRELRTFSNVVWQERHYDSWVSKVQQNEADFGPWRVDLENYNWPLVAARWE